MQISSPRWQARWALGVSSLCAVLCVASTILDQRQNLFDADASNWIHSFSSSETPQRVFVRSSYSTSMTKRRALLEMGTGLPVFTGLQDADGDSSSGGAGSTVDRAALGGLARHASIDSTEGLPSYKDGSHGFPSFKDWIRNDPKLQRSPPASFALNTQENGPDSEPMHLARLYTSPDARMIHRAAVAAASAFEDGDPSA